ncbi:YfgM family protein [Spongorhabdus nitratireducens]
MSTHHTDEEQLALLKRFWDEYGKSLVAGVVIAMVSVFGYKAWNKSQVESAEQAATLYQQVVDIMVYESEAALSEEQEATLNHVVSTLKQEYDDTPYAGYAMLFSARHAVETGDLAAAKEQLQWVINQKEGRDQEIVARIRLSRVLLATEGDNATAALKVLDEIKKPGGYKASVDAARGDVLLALGRTDEARTAYQAALDEARINGEQRPVVQMKLDDLAQPGQKDVQEDTSAAAEKSSDEGQSGGDNVNDESAEAK